MADEKYFLKLEYVIQNWFDDVRMSGVRVLVPINLYQKYHRITTWLDHDVRGDCLQSDLNNARQKYGDMLMYYLNVTHEYDDGTVEFELASSPANVVAAFVYIPRGAWDEYDDLDDYLEMLEIALQRWQNNENTWVATIVDDKGAAVEDAEISGDVETAHDRQWFEMCRKKYGITDEDIAAARNIMRAQKYRVCPDIYEIK